MTKRSFVAGAALALGLLHCGGGNAFNQVNNATDVADAAMRLANGFQSRSADELRALANNPCPTNAGLAGKWGLRDVRYNGDVCFREEGGAHHILWQLTSGEFYDGIAISEGDLVAVGFSDRADGYGVILYRIEGGRLTGRWTVPRNGGKMGSEVLEGPASLTGDFEIVSATNLRNENYGGHVSIRQTGQTYQLDWQLERETYRGVGVREGDWLVVGWGSQGSFGFVSYKKSGNRLNGRWAFAGKSDVQVENLEKL